MIFGQFDILPLINAAVYLAAFSYMGSPIWKAFCVSIFVFIASRCNYGRRTLTKIGIIILIVIPPFWTGVAPPLDDLITSAKNAATAVYRASK